MEIVAGVLGRLAGILLGAVAYFLWLLRKRKSNSVTGIQKEDVVCAQNSPERSSPFNSTGWTELGGSDVEEVRGQSSARELP